MQRIKSSSFVVALTMTMAMTVAMTVASAGAVLAGEVSNLVTHTQNDEQETLVADSIGKTLYVFDLDEGNPTPACNGDCAEVWPPYLLSAAEAASLESPLGSVARKNRKLQLTYSGKPVYTYALDRKAGDDLGDGIGGVWHYIELDRR